VIAVLATDVLADPTAAPVLSLLAVEDERALRFVP
jgi:hypothetical protein